MLRHTILDNALNIFQKLWQLLRQVRVCTKLLELGICPNIIRIKYMPATYAVMDGVLEVGHAAFVGWWWHFIREKHMRGPPHARRS